MIPPAVGAASPEHPLPLPRLPIVSLGLAFEARRDAVFTSYSGSVWRGYFGARLRQLACVTGAKRCDGCGMRSECAYAYLFETAPPADAPRMRKYNSVPHPLVLAPPPVMGVQSYPAGSLFPLDVRLFGRACDYAELVVQMLALVGRDGLGANDAPLRLMRIRSDQLATGESIEYLPGRVIPLEPACPEIPPCPDYPVEIRFMTPLRLVAGGRVAGPAKMSFRALFSSLLRRISMLTVFHTDHPLETDFAALVKCSEAVRIEAAKLRWQEWKRHSARQKRLVPMGGLVGHFTVDLTGAEALWPYLWLGQWTHVGKGTIMGLGGYSISAKREKAV